MAAPFVAIALFIGAGMGTCIGLVIAGRMEYRGDRVIAFLTPLRSQSSARSACCGSLSRLTKHYTHIRRDARWQAWWLADGLHLRIHIAVRLDSLTYR